MIIRRIAAMVPLVMALLLSAFAPSFAKDAAPMNTNDQGVFLDGYDVVSYFTTNEATLGSPKYTAEHNGTKFQFSSAENLELFKADPDKYMPEYGGYCAFAVANGKGTVKANPKTFKMYNGHLLMFFDDLYEGKRFNTIVPWNSNEPDFYSKAEQNWSQLSH